MSAMRTTRLRKCLEFPVESEHRKAIPCGLTRSCVQQVQFVVRCSSTKNDELLHEPAERQEVAFQSEYR